MGVRIASALLFVVLLLACFFFGYYVGKTGVEVVEPQKPVIRWIVKEPTNADIEFYRKAYKTPITITLEVKGTNAHVTAADTYKQTEQDFKLPEKKSYAVVSFLGGAVIGVVTVLLLLP